MRYVTNEQRRRRLKNLTSQGAPEIFGQSQLIITIQIQKKLDSFAGQLCYSFPTVLI
jgi:hypothetical protein